MTFSEKQEINDVTGTFPRERAKTLLLFFNLKKFSYNSLRIMNCNLEIHKEFENVEEFACPFCDERFQEYTVKNEQCC